MAIDSKVVFGRVVAVLASLSLRPTHWHVAEVVVVVVVVIIVDDTVADVVLAEVIVAKADRESDVGFEEECPVSANCRGKSSSSSSTSSKSSGADIKVSLSSSSSPWSSPGIRSHRFPTTDDERSIDRTTLFSP